LTGALYVL